jgi:hypothetical protein
VTVIAGVFESIVAAVIVAVCVAIYQRRIGQQISITEPMTNGFLPPAELRRGVQAHPVSGKLKYLPKGNRIWLIVADETNGKFWPQGFEPVDYHPDTETWKGYVTVFGWHRVTIIAVIAPPTSQDYFNYFQRVGQKTQHEPLLRIPLECKKRHSIQAKTSLATTNPVP